MHCLNNLQQDQNMCSARRPGHASSIKGRSEPLCLQKGGKDSKKACLREVWQDDICRQTYLWGRPHRIGSGANFQFGELWGEKGLMGTRALITAA